MQRGQQEHPHRHTDEALDALAAAVAAGGSVVVMSLDDDEVRPPKKCARCGSDMIRYHPENELHYYQCSGPGCDSRQVAKPEATQVAQVVSQVSQSDLDAAAAHGD